MAIIVLKGQIRLEIDKLHLKSLTFFQLKLGKFPEKSAGKFVWIFLAREKESRDWRLKKMTGSSHHNDGDDGNGCDGNGGTKDICGGDAGTILFSFY